MGINLEGTISAVRIRLRYIKLVPFCPRILFGEKTCGHCGKGMSYHFTIAVMKRLEILNVWPPSHKFSRKEGLQTQPHDMHILEQEHPAAKRRFVNSNPSSLQNFSIPGKLKKYCRFRRIFHYDHGKPPDRVFWAATRSGGQWQQSNKDAGMSGEFFP